MKKLLFLIAFAVASIAAAQPVCPPGAINQNAKWRFIFRQCMDSAMVLKYAPTDEVAYVDENGELHTISFGALVDSMGLGNFREQGILFAGDDGLPTDDSAYFRWNATNNTLNFGPGNGLDEINIYADSGENCKIYMEGGSGGLNGIVGATNWGTFLNPMPRPTRGTLFEISAARWNGANFTSTRGASMTLFSTQAPWSASANGMGVKMYCVANNSTTSIQSLQIWADGHISTSTVSSGRDTLWEFYCDGDMVIKTTRPSFMTGDSILVLDTADEVRAWRPYRDIAIKNDTNSFTGINIGGAVGGDEINVYAGPGENSKILALGGGSVNGMLAGRNFGTLTTPLPPTTLFNTLAVFGNTGWNGTTFNSTFRAGISLLNTQSWDAGNNNTAVQIRYVPNGSTTSTTGLQIWTNGNAAFSSNSSDTTDKLFVGGTLRSSGNITSGDNVIAASGGSLTWTSRSRIFSEVNGNIRLTNNAANNFGLLQFGGTTSAFPAIQRQGAVLRFRLADTSAFAQVQTGTLSVNGVPDASAAVTITSTTQGFLPPVMTATQGSAIASPAVGLLIYVTDTNGTFTSTGWWGHVGGGTWEKLNN